MSGPGPENPLQPLKPLEPLTALDPLKPLKPFEPSRPLKTLSPQVGVNLRQHPRSSWPCLALPYSRSLLLLQLILPPDFCAVVRASCPSLKACPCLCRWLQQEDMIQIPLKMRDHPRPRLPPSPVMCLHFKAEPKPETRKPQAESLKPKAESLNPKP